MKQAFIGALLYDPDCGFCEKSASFTQKYLNLAAEVKPAYPDELVAYRVDRARFESAIPYE
ncbi:hypothetical protein [Rothia sp. ZJ1223]|uniref:hypothetical protein n=1 Tax=Rothia sp. ZJ1223 TaxID=2811098 RepID=UPI00195E5558|nr:hypothetical protein [Rothia sp. ZJ1223]MBM7051631.1 hypothetical protein [Rothia sp. ZJ1223]